MGKDTKREAKIVFRYLEEVPTLYNPKVKKFLKVLYFIYLMVIVSVFLLNRDKFLNEAYLYFFGLIVLIIFSYWLFRNSQKFYGKVQNFMKNGNRVRGRIIGTEIKNVKNKNSLHLVVEYKDPQTKEKKTFLTAAVTGNPFELLSSDEVDVFLLGDEKFATGFKLAVDKTKNINQKRGR